MARAILTPAMKLRGVYTALGYRVAEVERNAGHAIATGGSGDKHLRLDRELLGRMAQRFDRDSGIYEGIVNRFVDAVLGPDGIALDPDTGNKRLDARIKADWQDWCEEPEVRGEFDWLECQKIGLRGVANDGDILALETDLEHLGGESAFRLQFIEAEELASQRTKPRAKASQGGRIDQGVELDAFNRTIAYHVATRSEDGIVQPGKSRRILAKDGIFVANRKRFSQTRGVPVLTSSFSMVHRITDVLNSEAIAWQNLAKFAVSVTRAGSAEQAFEESRADDDGRDAGKATTGGDLADRVMELEEAIVFFANPGEAVEPIARGLPGKEFPESIRMFLRLIGLPLGIPLEVILLDYSKSNYTASRAALEQAFRMFVAWQRWLIKKFHRKVYRRWLRWKIARDAAYPDRPETFIHRWMAPEFPWVDHLKEAQAWGHRIDRGLATLGMAQKSINMDYDDYLEQRATEIDRAIEKAREIEEKHKLPTGSVSWQLLAGLPASKQDSALEKENAGDEAGDEPSGDDDEGAQDDVGEEDDQ